MSNDPDSFWEGYRGQGTHSGTNQMEHQRGRLLRESELARARQDAEHAAQRAKAWNDLGGGRPMEPGALAGLALLVVLLVAGVLVWKARFLAFSLAGAILTAGLVLHGGLVLLKAAAWPRLGTTLRQAAAGYGVALLAALATGAGAWFLLRGGGPNLMPGIETLNEDNLNRWEPGWLTFALPLSAGVAAGTWWLNRALPPTGMRGSARWAALAGVLILCPIAARAMLGLF